MRQAVAVGSDVGSGVIQKLSKWNGSALHLLTLSSALPVCCSLLPPPSRSGALALPLRCLSRDAAKNFGIQARRPLCACVLVESCVGAAATVAVCVHLCEKAHKSKPKKKRADNESQVESIRCNSSLVAERQREGERDGETFIPFCWYLMFNFATVFNLILLLLLHWLRLLFHVPPLSISNLRKFCAAQHRPVLLPFGNTAAVYATLCVPPPHTNVSVKACGRKLRTATTNVRLKNGSLCMSVLYRAAQWKEAAVKPKKCSRGSKVNWTAAAAEK